MVGKGSATSTTCLHKPDGGENAEQPKLTGPDQGGETVVIKKRAILMHVGILKVPAEGDVNRKLKPYEGRTKYCCRLKLPLIEKDDHVLC